MNNIICSSSKSNKQMRHVTTQPLSEQGWGRCQAGFDGAHFGAEESAAAAGRSNQKRKWPKRMGLESATVDKEQGSLDIDWSSSSDNPSDTEPRQHQEASKYSPRKSFKRKKSCGSSRCQMMRRSLMREEEAFLEGDNVDVTDEEENQDGAFEEKEVMRPSKTSKKLELSPEDKKSTQIDISDYDTPSEDQVNVNFSSQQASSSLHISDQSPTPQPSPEVSPSKDSPWTGTEMLKKLKLPERTPDKQDAAGVPGGGGDSAKKKRKFIRGGLAENLQRVINREKSSMAFWAHRTSDTTTAQSLTLDLLVQSVEETRGLFVTQCQMRPLTSDDEEVTEEMFVLFTQANGRQLRLAAGLRLRVHPPWQKLTLSNYNKPVILCTHFCQSLDGSDESNAPTQSAILNGAAVMSPGKQLEPIQLFHPVPQYAKSESTLQSVLPVSTEATSGCVSDSFLDSIAQSGGYTMAGMCVRARIHRVYYHGCHAEPVSLNRKQQDIGKPVRNLRKPTRATQCVLLLQDDRGVFCELSVTLGNTGEEEEEIWRRSLRGGEGKTMVFAGLKVMRRVNRTRTPGLFSLIDSLWSPCEHPVSQSETESQSQGLESPQSFCYILGVQTLRNTIREEVPDRVRIPYREQVIRTLRELPQISETSTQRVAFYAKVILAHPEKDVHDKMQSQQQQPAGSNSSVWHLFLTDHSLNAEPTAERECEAGVKTAIARTGDSAGAGCSGWIQGMRPGWSQGTRPIHVHVRASCYLVESVEESFANPGSLVLLTDVCLDQGCFLYADTYTTIRRVSRECSGPNNSEMVENVSPYDDDVIIGRLSHAPIPPIPALDLDSNVNTLVSVTGVVTGIDEATAYSWPTCDTCGNNRLEAETSSGSQLHCGTCLRSVTSPVTRMHLELFLRCPSLDIEKTVVKVQLLQSSIEQVLPPLSSQEEGYDLQCIMGVHIGPISCFLKAVASQPGEPLTFNLEEVSLSGGKT